jgi:hypothetical protein
MGKYQALVDLSLGANYYVNAGDTVDTSDTRVPIGWIPPANAVSPLDADGVNKLFLAGPQVNAAEPWAQIGPWGQGLNRWVGSQSVFSPSTYWYRVTGDGMWALKGHESLGLRHVGSVMPGAGKSTMDVKLEPWKLKDIQVARFKLTLPVFIDGQRYLPGEIISSLPGPKGQWRYFVDGELVKYAPGLMASTLQRGMKPLTVGARNLKRLSFFAEEEMRNGN